MELLFKNYFIGIKELFGLSYFLIFPLLMYLPSIYTDHNAAMLQAYTSLTQT